MREMLLVDGVIVAVVLVSIMRLILTMVVTMVIALTVMVRMVSGTVPVHPRLADPPGCVLGEADPVCVVRHPGEDPRQSRLKRSEGGQESDRLC